MSATATHEPLFRAAKTADDLFPGEKIAMNIARMPDDPQKWPAHIQSEMLRHLPYLANYDVEIVLDRVEGEAGAALGYAQVRNMTVARPQDDAARAGNVIRIPIIIQDRRLQKFLVFEVGGQVFPLSEERVEQAMLSPSPFDTHAKKMPRSGSLVDQLYPPYQQRQGFGRIVDPGVEGLSKISSAPSWREKLAFVSYGGGGVSSRGLRLADDVNLSGQLGYSNVLGVVPIPDARLRLGNEQVGGSIGPTTIGVDAGHPTGAHLYYRPGFPGTVLGLKGVDKPIGRGAEQSKKRKAKAKKSSKKEASARLHERLRGLRR